MTSEESSTTGLVFEGDDTYEEPYLNGKNTMDVESTQQFDEGETSQHISIGENENVLEDGIVDMHEPEMQPDNSMPVVRRIVKRVRIVGGSSEPSSSSLIHSVGPIRKIYIRRRRTPEEEIAMGRFEQESVLSEEKRIPAPPGKRGRRPIMLPHHVTEPGPRSEAARRTGRPIVIHPSGVEFAIPSSLEAHPIQLSDTIPDNPSFDILKNDNGMAYCSQCHSVLRSFHALEYHIMSVHLKYRPFRCMFCVKEYFYTEDECIAHLKSIHIGKPIHIIRELIEEKEEQLTKMFQAVFIMIREAEDLNQKRIEGLQQAAYHQMQKYHRMRFKVPEVVARQRAQKDAAAQTFVTMAAPQTLIQMPVKPQFVKREPMMELVKLPSGEIVQQIIEDNRYIVDRHLGMAEHDFDQIDVVEDELGAAGYHHC